jgi:hypothetical protein
MAAAAPALKFARLNPTEISFPAFVHGRYLIIECRIKGICYSAGDYSTARDIATRSSRRFRTAHIYQQRLEPRISKWLQIEAYYNGKQVWKNESVR